MGVPTAFRLRLQYFSRRINQSVLLSFRFSVKLHVNKNLNATIGFSGKNTPLLLENNFKLKALKLVEAQQKVRYQYRM